MTKFQLHVKILLQKIIDKIPTSLVHLLTSFAFAHSTWLSLRSGMREMDLEAAYLAFFVEALVDLL